MSEKNDKSDYEVGYGKPPLHGRFKPGQSGNPKGRPKKKEPSQIDVSGVLEEPVVINLRGRKREISKFEAGLRAQVQKAIKGDVRAAKEFIKTCEQYDVIEPPEPIFEGGVVEAPKGVSLEDYAKQIGLHWPYN